MKQQQDIFPLKNELLLNNKHARVMKILDLVQYTLSDQVPCGTWDPMWHMGPGPIIYIGPGPIPSLGPNLFNK